jgi:lipoprotein-anchoring transpeptidase ErfK/SrfK
LKLSVNNNQEGFFNGQKVNPPKIDLSKQLSETSVLGTSLKGGEKHIYVDLDSQILYAYQGLTKIMQTPISSGKWGRTPVGNFNIWEKLVSTRMAGGEGADAYDLPNVPYVMYFYNDFGLHGAYWHNNFGHEMSHGCVNMRIVDARDLYNWADGPTGDKKGTAVSICNKFVAPNKCIQEDPIN